MLIKVENVVIVESCGADAIILHLDLPEGCYPYTGKATAKMNVAKGAAKNYVKDHFAEVKCQTITIRTD